MEELEHEQEQCKPIESDGSNAISDPLTKEIPEDLSAVYTRTNLPNYLPKCSLALTQIAREFLMSRKLARVKTMKAEITDSLKLAFGEENTSNVEARRKSQEAELHPILRLYSKLGHVSRKIATNSLYNNLITLTILAAGISVGAQNELTVMTDEAMLGYFDILDSVILGIFTSEVLLKIAAAVFKPWRYFYDSWNVFDFVIVVGSFVPGVGGVITVLRLLRLLRILKLIKRLPQLGMIINALIVGINSIFYIGLMLFMLFYVFAILGIILFGENDPWHFGSLHRAMISLFREATLDNVSGVMYVEYLYFFLDLKNESLYSSNKRIDLLLYSFISSQVFVHVWLR